MNREEKEICLRNMEEIKDFVACVSRCEGTADLKSGRYVVDAKLILGIFSLDITKPMRLAVDMKKAEREQFFREIQKYIVRQE